MVTENTNEMSGELTDLEGGEFEDQEVALDPDDDPDESLEDWNERKELEKKADKDEEAKKALEKKLKEYKKQERTEEEDDDPDESFDDYVKRKEQEKNPDPEDDDEVEPEKKPEPKEKDETKEDGEEDGEDDESSSSDEEVYKITVDGQEFAINKNDEDTIKEYLAKGKAADTRFQEAANMKREVTEFVKFAKTNPMEALAKLGIDVTKAAEDFIYKDMEFKQKPEVEQKYIMAQKELEAKNKEIEALREKQEQEKNEVEKARQAKELKEKIEQQREIFKTQFSEALAMQGLPANDYTLSRFVIHYRKAAEQGTANLESIAKLVKKDHAKELDEIRKSEVAKYKEKQKNSQFKKQPKVVRKKNQPKQQKKFTSIYQMQF